MKIVGLFFILCQPVHFATFTAPTTEEAMETCNAYARAIDEFEGLCVPMENVKEEWKKDDRQPEI